MDKVQYVVVRKTTYDCSECALIDSEKYCCSIGVPECDKRMSALGVGAEDYGKHCFKETPQDLSNV